ncbi:MAG: diguanylate cyclase [Candidatus Scalindua sp.]|nr:diguanylate cyclase [Candidatus Scalindua sp.]
MPKFLLPIGRFFIHVKSYLMREENLFVSKIFVVLLVAAISTFFYLAGTFDTVENMSLDQRFKYRTTLPVHPKIIIIEIAEDSIKELGRWPWNRERHAALTKAMSDWGVKALAFDILFPETSTDESDTVFAQGMKEAGNVYLPVAFQDLHAIRGNNIIQPIPLFENAAKTEGHISVQPDSDGLVRRIKLRVQYKNRSYYQLGLVLALDYYGIDPEDMKTGSNFLQVPLPGEKPLKIPLTKEGDMIINWAGRWTETFSHLSYNDVMVAYSQWLQGRKTLIPMEMFKDSLCIVGVTATGLHDIRSIPLEPAYPSVGINATVTNSLLQREFLSTTGDFENLLIIWCLSGLIFLITQRFGYFNTLLLIIALALSYTITSVVLFAYGNVIISLVYPLILIFFSSFALTVYHQIIVTIEKRRLTNLATKDNMTGLYNIGHFKLMLNAEIKSVKLRRNKDLSVIMFDLDFFKKINDSFGHAAGDEVLCTVSRILRTISRTLDVACRYGGEEFILMLPGTNRDNAVKIADKIRKSIEQYRFYLGDHRTPHRVTASFGVAEYHDGYETGERFIVRADKGLYQAKNSGRNRVCPI